MKNSRRAGIGATAIGAAAAVAALTAPNASALVNGITVSDAKVCLNKATTVTVAVTATSFLFDVSLSDNDTSVGNSKVSNSQAVFTWTPTTTGSHTLKATQEVISTKTITVDVVDCTPIPVPGTGSSASNPLAGLLSSLSAK
ncbi:hypothetical protein AB0I30_17825 [Nocardia tengchongensis]|uniref:hypothetical protein n=1 Tax=Nocardia tengchongensis TaxID=2055889 RepID=UPI0033F35B7B